MFFFFFSHQFSGFHLFGIFLGVQHLPSSLPDWPSLSNSMVSCLTKADTIVISGDSAGLFSDSDTRLTPVGSPGIPGLCAEEDLPWHAFCEANLGSLAFRLFGTGGIRSQWSFQEANCGTKGWIYVAGKNYSKLTLQHHNERRLELDWGNMG